MERDISYLYSDAYYKLKREGLLLSTIGKQGAQGWATFIDWFRKQPFYDKRQELIFNTLYQKLKNDFSGKDNDQYYFKYEMSNWYWPSMISETGLFTSNGILSLDEVLNIIHTPYSTIPIPNNLKRLPGTNEDSRILVKWFEGVIPSYEASLVEIRDIAMILHSYWFIIDHKIHFDFEGFLTKQGHISFDAITDIILSDKERATTPKVTDEPKLIIAWFNRLFHEVIDEELCFYDKLLTLDKYRKYFPSLSK